MSNLYSLPKEILIEKIIPQIQKEKDEEIKNLEKNIRNLEKNVQQTEKALNSLKSLGLYKTRVCAVDKCEAKAYCPSVHQEYLNMFFINCDSLEICDFCCTAICSKHYVESETDGEWVCPVCGSKEEEEEEE